MSSVLYGSIAALANSKSSIRTGRGEESTD